MNRKQLAAPLTGIRNETRCKTEQAMDSGEEGQSAIELALCLPMLLAIVIGLCTYGFAMNKYMVLTDAVNEGARQLAVSRGQTTDPCATVVYSITNAAPTLIAANLVYTLVLNGNSYSGTSCSSASTYSGAAGKLLINTPATVSVCYKYSFNMFGNGTSNSCLLTAKTTELVQ